MKYINAAIMFLTVFGLGWLVYWMSPLTIHTPEAAVFIAVTSVLSIMLMLMSYDFTN